MAVQVFCVATTLVYTGPTDTDEE